VSSISPVIFSVPNTNYEVVVLDYDRQNGLKGLVYNPRSSRTPVRWDNQWIAVKRGVKKDTGQHHPDLKRQFTLLSMSGDRKNPDMSL
jgi:hypothetical protein